MSLLHRVVPGFMPAESNKMRRFTANWVQSLITHYLLAFEFNRIFFIPTQEDAVSFGGSSDNSR